ncbi:MAG: hypothetical protein N0E48_24995 [Candidatus Thiodiazotropha endolucinida]|nr:hypothetical protein [Candidatus Thiodiazotropha taylori]MCW4346583.1 hypothetical protein [Candidatus Thiodiazotropha endolucinida]
MKNEVYDNLKNVSWNCYTCGLPNFSSSPFDSILYETSNRYDLLDPIPSHDDNLNISHPHPLATSSPNRDTGTISSTMSSLRLQSVSGFDEPLLHPSFSHDSIAPQAVRVSPQQRKDRPLRLIIVNCQSLVGKKTSLSTLCEESDPDIVLGTESWLTSDHFSAEVFPPGYKVFRKDRKRGKGGGVFILARESLQATEPEELASRDDCELIWIHIDVKGTQSLYVGCMYRPPQVDDTEYLAQLDTCLSRIPDGSHTWLGGDLNLPGIDWESNSVKTHAANNYWKSLAITSSSNR